MNKLDKNDFELVIGLEVHIQLNTLSKAFCRDYNVFGSDPNVNISPITLAHPGTLPKINKSQVEKAILLALATNSSINKRNQFDRKNYFYPDLPKGYQITQDKHPICSGGYVDFESKGKTKRIRLHHIHMEEDAGKSTHDLSPNQSMVDYNRAGTPLLEMVTEPDLRSGDEVLDFFAEVQRMVQFLGVSDGNMEEGSIRADCNVSIRKKGDLSYGERCEIKNVNSKKFAKLAVESEFYRQLKMLEKGVPIVKQTLNFNPDTGRTTPIRSKEDAHDYRYFPDPDLPPIILSENWINAIRKTMPKLAKQYEEDFRNDFSLSEYDAKILSQDKKIADYFIGLSKQTKNYKGLAKVIINKIIPISNGIGEKKIQDIISNNLILNFLNIIETGKVSPSMAYQILFPEMLKTPEVDLEALAVSLNIMQSDDQGFIDELINDLLEDHPEEVEKYKSGNKAIIGFFMGQAMRKSKGKADPTVLKNELLRKLSV